MRRILGTAGRRQKTHAPEDASGLAQIVVKDRQGDDVRLGSLWADGPAVVVFLRHYG
jgi:prostamide/prostaglandin F2alpha synthase